MVDLVIRNARVRGYESLQQVAVDKGRIVALAQEWTQQGKKEVDAQGKCLLPGFVDPHVHLDIALVNDFEQPGRSLPYQSQKEMMAAMEARKQAFTHEDLVQRAKALVDMAVRHGVTAIRAQVHIDPDVGLKHLEAMLEVKQQVQDRLTLQLVAFPNKELLRSDTLNYFEDALALGVDAMGCAPLHDEDRFTHMDVALDLAMKFNVDLDVHADLSLPRVVEVDDLDIVYLSRQVLARGYTGRVVAGHVSALDSVPTEHVDKVITLIRDAGISVISLPDLYRLGRDDSSHVRRGLTRVKEMLNAGINVAFASNNIRDCLRPYGNMNPLEEALILSYGAHMDEISQLEMLLAMATDHGAQAIHLQDYGLSLGCWADMILVDAPSPAAAILNQAEVCQVYKHGRLLVENERNSRWHVESHFPAALRPSC